MTQNNNVTKRCEEFVSQDLVRFIFPKAELHIKNLLQVSSTFFSFDLDNEAVFRAAVEGWEDDGARV